MQSVLDLATAAFHADDPTIRQDATHRLAQHPYRSEVKAALVEAIRKDDPAAERLLAELETEVEEDWEAPGCFG